MRGVIWFAAAFAAFVAGAHAQDASPPFFAAFKNFCVDTRANRAAMVSAVLRAGGELAGPHSDALPPPDARQGSAWRVVVGGHEFTVSSSTEDNVGRPSGRRTRTEGCVIMSYASEAPSISLLRQWPGVRAASDDTGKSGFTQVSFDYAETDGGRTPLADREAFIKAEDAGRAWHLQIMYDSKSAVVVFFRTMVVPTPAK